MPAVIGVVTSPTGAVIRDILHRLTDRFGVHLLLWGTLVQGPDAAAQVGAPCAVLMPCQRAAPCRVPIC